MQQPTKTEAGLCNATAVTNQLPLRCRSTACISSAQKGIFNINQFYYVNLDYINSSFDILYTETSASVTMAR